MLLLRKTVMNMVLICVVTVHFVNIPYCQGNNNHHHSEDDHDEPESLTHSHYSPSSEDHYKMHTDKNLKMNIPIILWWNELYPYLDKNLPVITCKNVKCYSTPNKKYLSDPRTRGIMFYGTDVDPADLPLPRTTSHEWALIHEESPLNNFMLNHNAFMKLINHTATFRRESDFPITTQNIYHTKFLTEKQPVSLEIKNSRRQKESLAAVLYVQSHCEVPSDRDRYVSELMKYIAIDSYGACLHNKDLPSHLQDPVSNFEREEFLELISSYKFHLAFENAICKDYMTEKLMRPLHIGSVPIYKGSPYAKEWMPNNRSIILVDDFESPKQLAEFIKYLDENDEEYEKYLEFKKPGGVTNNLLKQTLASRKWHMGVIGHMEYFRAFECHLCEKITERLENENAHALDHTVSLFPPRMANSSHLGCPQPYTSVGNPDDIKDNNDIWKKMEWINMHWEGFDQARAVRDMLLNNEQNPKNYHKYLKLIE